jgi:hypothetical protein
MTMSGRWSWSTGAARAAGAAAAAAAGACRSCRAWASRRGWSGCWRGRASAAAGGVAAVVVVRRRTRPRHCQEAARCGVQKRRRRRARVCGGASAAAAERRGARRQPATAAAALGAAAAARRRTWCGGDEARRRGVAALVCQGASAALGVGASASCEGKQTGAPSVTAYARRGASGRRPRSTCPSRPHSSVHHTGQRTALLSSRRDHTQACGTGCTLSLSTGGPALWGAHDAGRRRTARGGAAAARPTELCFTTLTAALRLAPPPQEQEPRNAA